MENIEQRKLNLTHSNKKRNASAVSLFQETTHSVSNMQHNKIKNKLTSIGMIISPTKLQDKVSTIPIKCSVQLVEFFELTNHSLKLTQTCTHLSN